jgi:hypothetical protein
VLLHFEVSIFCEVYTGYMAISPYIRHYPVRRTQMRICFSSKNQSKILVGLVLLAAICLSTKSGAASSKVPDDTTRITIAKGQFVNPSEMTGVLQPFSKTSVVEEAITAPQQPAPNASHPSRAAGTRMNSKRSVISSKSALKVHSPTGAKHKTDQPIKVPETRENWMKVTWYK